jgi:hypothetical protein
MPVRTQPRSALLFTALALLLAGGRAAAQMTPVADLRELAAHAHFGSASEGNGLNPPGFFAPFQTYIDAFAETDDGFAEGFAFQTSQFYAAGINASGSTSGGTQGPGGGTYDAESLAGFHVRMDTCVEYFLDATVEPGKPLPASRIEVRDALAGLTLIRVDDGHQQFTGRLSPGEYVIEGRSSVASSELYVNGGAYAIIWTCGQCPSTLIAAQPVGIPLVCGTTAVFNVTPAVPVGSLTFQWRRNLVPLTNNGHTSGVNTPTLSIVNPCHPDTGFYDVLVSDGSIIEPSRLAHLSATGVTGVERGPAAAAGGLVLEPAWPNPFAGATSFRYAAERPVRVTAAIYDVSGREIRPLADRMLLGTGTLTWDGRTASGSPAPSGLYFLRVTTAHQAHVRRVALVR